MSGSDKCSKEKQIRVRVGDQWIKSYCNEVLLQRGNSELWPNWRKGNRMDSDVSTWHRRQEWTQPVNEQKKWTRPDRAIDKWQERVAGVVRNLGRFGHVPDIMRSHQETLNGGQHKELCWLLDESKQRRTHVSPGRGFTDAQNRWQLMVAGFKI